MNVRDYKRNQQYFELWAKQTGKTHVLSRDTKFTQFSLTCTGKQGCKINKFFLNFLCKFALGISNHPAREK